MKKSTATALLVGASMWSTSLLFANHPVLVEGNCDSPTPGTTVVTAGTCGDYDGDGRIGTAEDTDGPDRIFGTINAALSAGTGGAAGQGANFNGTVTIVSSGRFAEVIVISPAQSANIGTITIEAAPGVNAGIDAVLQGDPAGGNAARQAEVGITLDTPATSKVILRNLKVRNYLEGVRAMNNSRVYIENCRFEHNLNFGLRAMGDSNLHVTDTSVLATGFRFGSSPNTTPSPGTGIQFEGTSRGAVVKSSIVGSFAFGLANQRVNSRPVIFYELMYGDNGSGAFFGTVERREF
jgi:hypothetical protein